jgi:hypothetical protein
LFIVAAIRRSTFGIMPSLPAQYYGELGQVTNAAPTTANPPVAPAAQSDTSERRAGVSVIASDSEIVPAWHTRMTESGKTIQVLKALGVQARPSSGDRKSKLCLSFHLRGSCFDNCGNKVTHRKLSVGGTKAMDTFVEKHL